MHMRISLVLLVHSCICVGMNQSLNHFREITVWEGQPLVDIQVANCLFFFFNLDLQAAYCLFTRVCFIRP